MTDQSTIRAEMRTRAAGLSGDSIRPTDAKTVPAKKSRISLWVVLAVGLVGIIWWLRRA